MTSKHWVFLLTAVSASKVPAILKKFVLNEAEFDFGRGHFETVLGSQAVFM